MGKEVGGMMGIKGKEKVPLKKLLTKFKLIQKVVKVSDHQVKQKHNHEQ